MAAYYLNTESKEGMPSLRDFLRERNPFLRKKIQGSKKKHGNLLTIRPTTASIGFNPSACYLSISRAKSLSNWLGLKWEWKYFNVNRNQFFNSTSSSWHWGPTTFVPGSSIISLLLRHSIVNGHNTLHCNGFHAMLYVFGVYEK